MKGIIISLILTVAIIGGAFILATNSDSGGVASTSNVTTENGSQIIAIAVKGDYQPRLTEAKAGVPSVLRLETNGTYSCALALKVAALGYQEYLKPSGVTDITVPPQKAGTSLQGICSMGMYNFTVRFI